MSNVRICARAAAAADFRNRGSKRVAIAGADGGVKMVPLNQRFSYGGYDYIARHNRANDVTVEVVGK